MKDLDFIEDSVLRQTIEESIEYIFILFSDTKIDGVKALYKKETCRVIILYIISIIEAILMYLYKKRGDKITFTEYKSVSFIPEIYPHSEDGNSKVVIAIQKESERVDSQIGIRELVLCFKDTGDITDSTASDILKLHDIRNTFHFNKSRDQIVFDIEQIEDALKLLVYVIKRAPKRLLRKI